MRAQTIHRISGNLLVVLSLTALVTVLSGYVHPPQPPPTDEGTAAHIFQLAIAAFAPTLLAFVATVDPQRPLRSMRTLLFPVVALIVAFAALYHLEH